MEPFIGQISMFGFDWAPRDWALCDGRSMAISQNQALYSLIGVIYGGDARNNFALPDLRGRFPLCQGKGTGSIRTLAQNGGGESVLLSTLHTPLATHTHTATFIPNVVDTSVNIAIPVTSAANATTSSPDTTTILGKGDVDLSSVGSGVVGANLYSAAAANTTLKPFSVAVPASTGTVAVNYNKPTLASHAVPLMNPFLVINFCIALVGYLPQRP